jgi:hypothetical protein
MDSILLALKSRTFWTLVVTFLFNGFQAIEPSLRLDPGMLLVINGALGLLATYFHITPSQSYGASKLEEKK